MPVFDAFESISCGPKRQRKSQSGFLPRLLEILRLLCHRGCVTRCGCAQVITSLKWRSLVGAGLRSKRDFGLTQLPTHSEAKIKWGRGGGSDSPGDSRRWGLCLHSSERHFPTDSGMYCPLQRLPNGRFCTMGRSQGRTHRATISGPVLHSKIPCNLPSCVPQPLRLLFSSFFQS